LDRSGWEHPNLLFAIRGPEDDLRLEYVMQLPGDTTERLLDLVDAGVRTDAGVLGIALAAAGAIVGILRDGYTTVVAHRRGDRLHVAEVTSERLGDHGDVAAVAMRLLAADCAPTPGRGPMPAPRAVCA
jgi:hypothetical protein